MGRASVGEWLLGGSLSDNFVLSSSRLFSLTHTRILNSEFSNLNFSEGWGKLVVNGRRVGWSMASGWITE